MTLDESGDAHAGRRRVLLTAFSERDMRKLFCMSVETPEIEDEHGVPFHIFCGVSDNARKVIGHEPADDSEVRFAEDIARLLNRKESKA